MFENAPKPNSESPQITILLAEDDNSVRRFIEIILNRANYSVLTAEDGLAALKLTNEAHIDLIVADAMMPNLSGFDLLRIVRQNPAHEKIPFIILSGFDVDTNETQADAYLTKGEHLKDQLLETISILADRVRAL